MTSVFDLCDAHTGEVLDTVTFDDTTITYATGEAEPLVETRGRLIPDRALMVASFDDWSNGYLLTRRRGS